MEDKNPKPIPCFGGHKDGMAYHGQADPPFGYWEHEIQHRGKRRRIFIKNGIKAESLNNTILRSALDAKPYEED